MKYPKDPHAFVNARTFSAEKSEMDVLTIADACILADEIVRLKEALTKLASMEAFIAARGVHKERDEELLDRIEYARLALKGTQ